MVSPLLFSLLACQPDPTPPSASSGIDSGSGSETSGTDSGSDSGTTPKLLLNELLASNTTYGKDGSGNSADWIELYNASEDPIELGDYALGDGSEEAPWSLPDEALAPGGYRLLWASGEDSDEHTDFKLSADGETVTLFGPQGEVTDRVSFPRQRTDISYGRLDGGDWYAFETPTPEAANSTRPILPTPTFSVDGGFSGGDTVEVFTHPGALLTVTIDGSDPSQDGLAYDGPIALGMPEEAVSEDGAGVWTFSSDPGFSVRHDGSDPNFEWGLADGILRVRMTREASVQRLYLPLQGGPFGNANEFRLRTRFRILQAAAASVELGFLSSTDNNITDNLVGLDFYDEDRGLSGYMGEGYGTCDGEAVQGNTWYVAEYSGRATDPSFTLTLFDETGTTQLDQCAITTSGTGGAVDVIGFANEDRSESSSTEEVEFDWVTWAIDEALPADPAASPEPVRIVRAIASLDGWAPSEVATRTFLEDGPGAMPTLSLVVDPDDLWDAATGIYANPQERGEEWERAASLEFYPLEGEPVTVLAGVRIHGEGSRGSAKQSFRIISDAEHGGSHLPTLLSGGLDDARYSTMVLGGGSNDSSSAPQGDHYAGVWTLIRDATATDLYQDLA
ncbi:MAG: hypothetical protein ACI8RZ_005838, partial [Myxococcota bacterium]